MRRIIKNIFVGMVALSLMITPSVRSNAAAMNTFPAQNTSSYTVQYTRAIQVMMLNYNTTTRAYIVNSGGVDGSYGPNTKNAVISFQVATGLTPDGSCGPNTWSKLNATLLSNGYSGGFALFRGYYPYTTNCMRHSTDGAMTWYTYHNSSWYYVG